jgi:hypothetical protein
MLFPALNGVLDPSDRARRDLRGLLSASREVKPVAALSTEAVRGATAQLASVVKQELNERLP